MMMATIVTAVSANVDSSDENGKTKTLRLLCTVQLFGAKARKSQFELHRDNRKTNAVISVSGMLSRPKRVHMRTCARKLRKRTLPTEIKHLW